MTTSATLEYLERRMLAGTGLPKLLQMRRADLPVLCRELGYRTGAEIGVWKGAFSASFCQANPDLRWLCVDPWTHYPDWHDPKNDLPDADIAAAFQEAQRRLQRFRYCTIHRAFSAEAARTIPDASLDLVYLDGNHGRNAVLTDLDAWVPKVRPGGIIAGHDYRKYPEMPAIRVMEAVQYYTTLHQIDPWFILTRDKTPSWLWVID